MTLYNALCARLRAARDFLVSQYHYQRQRAALALLLARDSFVGFLHRLASNSYPGYLVAAFIAIALLLLIAAVEAVIDGVRSLWRPFVKLFDVLRWKDLSLAGWERAFRK